jgi:hypothetical protein
VIIYDLLSNQYEEVDYVIKTLKTAELGENQQKTLILLSTVSECHPSHLLIHHVFYGRVETRTV